MVKKSNGRHSRDLKTLISSIEVAFNQFENLKSTRIQKNFLGSDLPHRRWKDQRTPQ